MNDKMGSKPCCNDKEFSLKVNGEQTPAKALQPTFHPVAVHPIGLNFSVSNPIETTKLLPEVFAPPPEEKDFHQLYCVYRI